MKYMNETLVVTTADAKDEHENESEGPLSILDTERGSMDGILCVRRIVSKGCDFGTESPPLHGYRSCWGGCCCTCARVDETFLLVGSMTGWRIWPCAGMCLIVIRTPSWHGCYCSAWFDEKEGKKKRIYGLGLAESRFTGRRIMVGLLWDVGVSALVLGKSYISNSKRVVLYVCICVCSKQNTKRIGID